jgi:hypothetical protein
MGIIKTFKRPLRLFPHLWQYLILLRNLIYQMVHKILSINKVRYRQETDHIVEWCKIRHRSICIKNLFPTRTMGLPTIVVTLKL